jgi:hypothetical protein
LLLFESLRIDQSVILWVSVLLEEETGILEYWSTRINPKRCASHELLTLPEYSSSTPVFGVVRITQSYFSVFFCRSLCFFALFAIILSVLLDF